MKKLFTFFAVILSLLGASQSASAWVFYVDVSNRSSNSSWTGTIYLYGHYSNNGGGWTNTTYPSKDTSIPYIKKIEVNDFPDLDRIAFGTSSSFPGESNLYNGTTSIGTITQGNGSSDWAQTDGACYKISASGNGVSKIADFVESTISNVQVYHASNYGEALSNGNNVTTSQGNNTWESNKLSLTNDTGAWDNRLYFRVQYANNTVRWVQPTSTSPQVAVGAEYTTVSYATSHTNGYGFVPGSSGDLSFSLKMASNLNEVEWVKYSQASNTPDKLYYLGGAGNNWDPSNPYEFSTTDGVTYTAEIEFTTGSDSNKDNEGGIKISTSKGSHSNDWDPFNNNCLYCTDVITSGADEQKLYHPENTSMHVCVKQKGVYTVTITKKNGTYYISGVMTGGGNSATASNGFYLSGTLPYLKGWNGDQQGHAGDWGDWANKMYFSSPETVDGVTSCTLDFTPNESSIYFRLWDSSDTAYTPANFNVANNYGSTTSISKNSSGTCTVTGLTTGMQYTMKISIDSNGTMTVSISIKSGYDDGGTYPQLETSSWDIPAAMAEQAAQRGGNADDQVLYFYMSQYQNDNRVSPEWQLIKQADGTYVLDDFMVIPNGGFKIREIKKQNGAYVATDYGSINDGAFDLNLTRYGIDSNITDRHPSITVHPEAGADRGFRWDIGYTMAKLTLNPSSSAATPSRKINVASAEDMVIYMTPPTNWNIGNNDKVYAHLWDDGVDRGHGWPGREMSKLSDGTYYLVYNNTAVPKKILFNVDGDNSRKTGDLSLPASFGTTAMAVMSTNGGTPTVYTGAIKQIEVAEIPAGSMELKCELNFDQPSTVKYAPKPGIPYIALMGSALTAPVGTGQTLSYPAQLDDKLSRQENAAYTNGYIQFDSNHQPYVYGPHLTSSTKNLYSVSGKGGNLDSSHTPAAGQVMSSTIMPPRHRIWFRAEDSSGNGYEFSSRNTIFSYEGVVSDVANSSAIVPVAKDERLQPTGSKKANSGTRYAKYTLKDFNMMGLYKIFTGYGAHNYNTVTNGLSQFTNWGVEKENGGAPDFPYEKRVLTSGKVTPLSGGGPVLKNGRTQRTFDQTGYDNNAEDNNAGVYVQFQGRNFVSEAVFYLALDYDGLDSGSSDHYYTRNASSDPRDDYNNNGRNFSWIMFEYGNAKPNITLQKRGANTGVMNWIINDGEGATSDERVKKYVVKLFKTDEDGNKLSDTPVFTYTSEDYPSTASGWLQGLTGGPESRGNLENGYYTAFLEYEMWTKTDGGSFSDSSYRTGETSSNTIYVFTVDTKPALLTEQVFDDATDAYSFDVKVTAGATAYFNEVLKHNSSASPANLTLTYTIGTFDNRYQQIYVDNTLIASSPYLDGSVTYSNGGATFTLKNLWTSSETSLIAPAVRVTDYVPDDSYLFGVSVHSTYTAGEDPYREAMQPVESPDGVFEIGNNSVIVAESDGRFNKVTVDGTLKLNDATLMASTADNFEAVYQVSVRTFSATNPYRVITGDRGISYNKTGHTGNNNTLDVPVSVDYLGYRGESSTVDGVTYNVAADQTYTFVTEMKYIRKGDGASSDYMGDNESYAYVYEEQIPVPRQDIKDRTDGGDAQDWVRLTYEYGEKYAGAAFAYEDAYVAAEITHPHNGKGDSDKLAFSFDANRQRIYHNLNSNYSVRNYDAVPPMLREDKNSNHQWWNTGTHERPAGFEERFRMDPETGAENTNIPEHTAYWAGYAPDGKENDSEYHPMNSYYDSRNQHVRKGWLDGELLNANFFSALVAETAQMDNEGHLSEITKLLESKGAVGNPFTDLDKANKVLDDIKMMTGTTLDVNGDVALAPVAPDAQENWKGTDYGKEIYLQSEYTDVPVNRVMKHVSHVNGESWWQPSEAGKPYDMFARWKNSSMLGGNYTSDEDILQNYIMVSPKDYMPMQYVFVYDYPMLNNFNHTSMTAVTPMALILEAPSGQVTNSNIGESDCEDVSGLSSGLIPFEGAVVTSTAGTPTNVEDVDVDANANLTVVYDRATAMLSVRTGGNLGTVTVTAVSGAVVKNVPATKGCNALDLDLSSLASGAYIVTVDGAHGTKILR